MPLNTGSAQFPPARTVCADTRLRLSGPAGSQNRPVIRDNPAGQRAGLLMNSVIMTDNLATILFSEIDRRLGVFDQMAGVDAALRKSFGI